MTTAMHVIFWVYFADRWQGVRLAPGESATLDHHDRTDEGWSSVRELYTLSADGTVVEVRMTTEWRAFCRVDRLESNPADEHGPARPSWTQHRRSQRDYAAEGEGY